MPRPTSALLTCKTAGRLVVVWWEMGSWVTGLATFIFVSSFVLIFLLQDACAFYERPVHLSEWLYFLFRFAICSFIFLSFSSQLFLTFFYWNGDRRVPFFLNGQKIKCRCAAFLLQTPNCRIKTNIPTPTPNSRDKQHTATLAKGYPYKTGAHLTVRLCGI